MLDIELYGVPRGREPDDEYRTAMTFSLDTHWVWDFWVADDGDLFHLYYLHAPKSLGDERLRHRNARIGHATSADLRSWHDHGPVLGPGESGAFDETATWTGCVVRGDDGLWRMFYTGSRFVSPDSMANVEAIGLATSTDLHEWTKAPGPILTADPRWYETLADGTWREEAWRDPWVFPDGAGGWHMLVTARGRDGRGDDRGVIGHAVSDDLVTWSARPPLSAAGAGFAHLEVPQIVEVEGRLLLVFSCDGPALAGSRTGDTGGVWWLPADRPSGPFSTDAAALLVDDALYAGRIVTDRDGSSVLLAFDNRGAGAEFSGVISDPLPLAWDAVRQTLAVAEPERLP